MSARSVASEDRTSSPPNDDVFLCLAIAQRRDRRPDRSEDGGASLAERAPHTLLFGLELCSVAKVHERAAAAVPEVHARRVGPIGRTPIDAEQATPGRRAMRAGVLQVHTDVLSGQSAGHVQGTLAGAAEPRPAFVEPVDSHSD